ncbi:hypothetical protein AVEN_43707-1 [Araneus ventricosus]|uniref:F-box/LRR-repeat protein 2 n=1 Tax=Araneus ventricosus TaxID=182803 RepID=A0A4Y2BYI9_ARAVE|nr:hypothetical protein AVEN_43707-1 [Araneus ventricosus]
MMYFDDDDVDDPEVVEEENDDDDDDLNYYEPEDFDYPDDKYEAFADLERRNNGTAMLSLQDICLLSISKNLPRFNLAFSTTEDSEFRRNLQFLQRFHSSYLIKAATRGCRKLDESYFDFLLNEYIKEFDMDVLYRCDWGNVIKRISEIGHGFQKVRFNFPDVSDFELVIVDFVNKVVCHLPNVKILDLTPYCNDSTLEIIASSCLQLKELHIDDCSVTDKGLRALCQENDDNVGRLNLKHLSLPSIVGVNEGIAYVLQNMPSLEVIVHPDLPYILHNMHKDSMSNTLERKYNLTSLYLGANSPWEDTPTITDILTLFSDICPHIKEISMPLASKEHLDLCFRFPELETFNVNNNITPNLNLDLNEFLKSKGGLLRRLQVEKFSLSVAVLVQNCPKLEKLDLLSITFQYLDTSTTLQPLNNLQELSLGYFSFGDALVRRSVIDMLNSSQKIEKLTLLCCKFENNEEFVTRLSKFCENETLKYLKFTNCDVDDAFLQSVLLTCSNLKTLVVEYCDNITATHIDNLYEISNSLKSQTKIIWTDDRSEFNSIDSGDDDIFDDYSEYDSDDFDNHDPYDSDNLYYGYDSDGY